MAGQPTGGGGAAPLAGRVPQAVAQQGRLVAGGLMDVPPVDYYDADGKPAGVNADLADAVGAKLGIDIAFRKLAFSGLRTALVSGKIDIIWDSINDTAEREQSLDFVDYLKAGYTLLVKHGAGAQIKSLADLCGATMATVRGAAQIKAVNAQSSRCVNKGKQRITLKLYDSASSARLQVKTGRVKAFIGNAPVLLYLAKKQGNGSVFDAVVLKNAGTSYYGVSFAKGDSKLRDAFVAALKQTLDDGTYQKILDRYGLGALAVDAIRVNAAGS